MLLGCLEDKCGELDDVVKCDADEGCEKETEAQGYMGIIVIFTAGHEDAKGECR